MDGIIVMWSGAIVDIPAGWHLCDGTDGTPDMRNRFLFGALNQGEMNDTGGMLTHEHDFEGDGHAHVIPLGFPIATGAGYQAETDDEVTDGTTDSASSLPPYYALAFIMFVGLPS